MEDKIKVLFADDHIPDNEILSLKTCEEIRQILKKRKPQIENNLDILNGWTNAYYAASEVVRAFESPKINFITANKHKKAKDLIKRDIDIAIVDIGWFNDESLKNLPSKDKETAGWEIAECAAKDTLLIAYSSRFKTNPKLADDAASHGMLPFFKMNTEPEAEKSGSARQNDKEFEDQCIATARALRSTADFLVSKSQLTDPKNVSLRTSNKALDTFDDAQRSARQWTVVALLFATISMVLILVGVVLAFAGNLQSGILTTLTSAITSAVSGLFYKQFGEQNKKAANAWKIYKQEQDKLRNEVKPDSQQ